MNLPAPTNITPEEMRKVLNKIGEEALAEVNKQKRLTPGNLWHLITEGELP